MSEIVYYFIVYGGAGFIFLYLLHIMDNRDKKRKLEERLKRLENRSIEPPPLSPNHTCPHCGKSLENMPTDILKCPYCGQKLEN